MGCILPEPAVRLVGVGPSLCRLTRRHSSGSYETTSPALGYTLYTQWLSLLSNDDARSVNAAVQTLSRGVVLAPLSAALGTITAVMGVLAMGLASPVLGMVSFGESYGRNVVAHRWPRRPRVTGRVRPPGACGTAGMRGVPPHPHSWPRTSTATFTATASRTSRPDLPLLQFVRSRLLPASNGAYAVHLGNGASLSLGASVSPGKPSSPIVDLGNTQILWMLAIALTLFSNRAGAAGAASKSSDE